MPRERLAIEQVRDGFDRVGRLALLALLVGVGIAAIRSGGWQGGLFAAVCFLIVGAAGLRWWRRRDRL